MPHKRREGPSEREPLRNIRASDELWHAAQEAVKARHDPGVSEVVRRALAAYIRETDRKRLRGELPGQRSEPE